MSSLRPKAYICVFSDNPRVKKLTAVNFGVYVFPRSFKKDPETFIGTFGSRFINENKSEACILHLETNKESRIVSHQLTYHSKSYAK